MGRPSIRRGERSLHGWKRPERSNGYQPARMLIMFHQELGSKSRKAFLDSGEFGARIPAEVLPSHPALYGKETEKASLHRLLPILRCEARQTSQDRGQELWLGRAVGRADWGGACVREAPVPAGHGSEGEWHLRSPPPLCCLLSGVSGQPRSQGDQRHFPFRLLSH